MFKDANNKKIPSANIKFVAIGCGILGIVFCIVPNIFKFTYTFLNSILVLIGNILMTYAISSVLIDFFAFGDYLKGLISSLFTEYEMLNVLSDKHKMELRHNIIMTDLDNSNSDCVEFVDFVDKEIDSSIHNLYYKDYVESVDIELYNGMIKKTIIKDVVIDDIAKKDHSFTTILSNQFVPLENGNEPISIKLVKIDDCELKLGTDEKDGDYYLVKKELSSNGSYSISYKYVLSNPKIIKNDTRLKLIYETFVPNNDLIFQIKAQYMCKNMKLICNTKSKDLELNAMSFNLSSAGKGFDICNVDKNKIEISSKKWLFAGEGIVISIINKDCFK